MCEAFWPCHGFCYGLKGRLLKDLNFFVFYLSWTYPVPINLTKRFGRVGAEAFVFTIATIWKVRQSRWASGRAHARTDELSLLSPTSERGTVPALAKDEFQTFPKILSFENSRQIMICMLKLGSGTNLYN